MAFKRIWHQTEVLAALEAGAVIVTSGERLARAVRLAHGEARLAAGARVWERPEVMSYGAFLNRLYDRAADAALSSGGCIFAATYLDAAAEAPLGRVNPCFSWGAALLQPAATAREAARAWMLLVAYRVPVERLGDGDEDALAFAAWVGQFRNLSRRDGWLEDARLADWLATQLRKRALPPPAGSCSRVSTSLPPSSRN